MERKTDSVRKGQVSAEMILIIAAVLAVAFILVSQLQATAEKGAAAVDNRTDALLDRLNGMGVPCQDNTDCEEGTCSNGVCAS